MCAYTIILVIRITRWAPGTAHIDVTHVSVWNWNLFLQRTTDYVGFLFYQCNSRDTAAVESTTTDNKENVLQIGAQSAKEWKKKQQKKKRVRS